MRGESCPEGVMNGCGSFREPAFRGILDVPVWPLARMSLPIICAGMLVVFRCVAVEHVMTGLSRFKVQSLNLGAS